MATRKPMKKFKRYDEGGDVSEAKAKQRGLDISNKEEPVGFFERIRAGNIDQPGTEAYNRFGAGRGYAKNMDDENEAMREAMRSPSKPSAPAASSRDLSDDMYSDYGPSEGRSSSETIKPTRQVMNKPTLPAKPTAPNKQSTGFYMPPSSRDKPNYSNEGRTKPAPASAAASQIPGGSKTPAPQGEKIDSSETSRNLENAATALGVGAGAAGLYKLGSKLFKGAKKAKDAVSPYIKEIGMDTKKLTGPSTTKKASDVTDVVPKKTSYRSETNPTKREDGKANEAYDRLMKLTRKKDDGMKKGGKVMKYASGGMVGSASKRADGIASKGKTRCKIC